MRVRNQGRHAFAGRMSRTFLHPVRFMWKPKPPAVGSFANEFPAELILLIAQEVANVSASDLLNFCLACTTFAHFGVPLLQSYRLTVGIPIDMPSLERTDLRIRNASQRLEGMRLDNIRMLTLFWDLSTAYDLGWPNTPFELLTRTRYGDPETEIVVAAAEARRESLLQAMPSMAQLRTVRILCWNPPWAVSLILLAEHVVKMLKQVASMPGIQEIMHHQIDRRASYGAAHLKRFAIRRHLNDDAHFNRLYPYRSMSIGSTCLTKVTIINGCNPSLIMPENNVSLAWREILAQHCVTIRDVRIDGSMLEPIFTDWNLIEGQQPKLIRLERFILSDDNNSSNYYIRDDTKELLSFVFRHDDHWTPDEPVKPVVFDIRGLRVLKLSWWRSHKHTLDSMFMGHMPQLQHFSTAVQPHGTIARKDVLFYPMKLEEIEVLDDNRGQTKQYNLKYLSKHGKTLKRLTTYEHWLQDNMAELLAKKLVVLEKLTTACNGNAFIHLLHSFRNHATLSELVIDDWEHEDYDCKHFARVMEFINSGGGKWNHVKFRPKKTANIPKTQGKVFNYIKSKVENAKTIVPLKTTMFVLKGMPENLETIRAVVRDYSPTQEVNSVNTWTWKRIKKDADLDIEQGPAGFDGYVWVMADHGTYVENGVHGYEVYTPPAVLVSEETRDWASGSSIGLRNAIAAHDDL